MPRDMLSDYRGKPTEPLWNPKELFSFVFVLLVLLTSPELQKQLVMLWLPAIVLTFDFYSSTVAKPGSEAPAGAHERDPGVMRISWISEL